MEPNPCRPRASSDLTKLHPQAGKVDCASARFSEIGYRHSVHLIVADTIPHQHSPSGHHATLTPNERVRSADRIFQSCSVRDC
ncbi:hypothetical protein EBB04_19250 [Sinorhizobium meliloti]|nr:hypothetical protein EBB04_19250 [Sinorhizobium meliloti]